MLSAEQIDQAASYLLAARAAKAAGPRIPERYRPSDIDSALAVQERVFDRLGESVGGWKCGLPNSLNEPIVAAIPESSIFQAIHCPVPGNRGQIEPEIAFVMARALPPRTTPYSDDEIQEAIEESRIVLELLASRYADPVSVTTAEILADACNNHGLLIGPAIPNALDYPLERLHVMVGTTTGTLFDEERAHPSGHPLKALAWLVHFLNGRGQGLKAGEIVTTGSYAGVIDAPLNQRIHVKMNGLASLDVELITDQP